MGPEWWLAGGVGAALALLSLGWWARGLEVRLLEGQRDALAAQLAEALEQGERGVEAARIVLETSRRSAAAAAERDPVRRRLLLLGVDPASAAPPSGEAAGPDGAAGPRAV